MRIGLGMSIVGGGGGLFTSLADIGGVPTAAYSVRKVNSAYSGAAIRVRESSGDTETDIGFVGQNLDEAALLAHCGANDGFVTKWYDQSGSGYDAVQATAGSQPKIVSAGTVIKENGLPALQYDGNDDSLTIGNDSLHRNVSYSHIYAVNALDVTNVLQTIYFAATGDNQNSKSRVNLAILSTNKANTGGRRLDSDSGQTVTSTASLTANTQYLRVSEFDFATSDLHQYLNGSVDGSSTSFQTDGNTSDTDSLNANGANITIGSLGGNINTYNGTIQEIVLYNSDKSSLRTAIEGNINGYYSIYTP